MVKRAPWVKHFLWLSVLAVAACSSEGEEERTCATACNSPPPAECIGSWLRTYESEGSCVQGQCQYTFNDRGCPEGCIPGTDGGAPAECAPEPSDGGVPDALGEPDVDLGPEDGGGEPSPDAGPEPLPDMAPDVGPDMGPEAGPEPAPDMDPCAGIVCNAPPPPACPTGTTLHTFSGPGTCVGGVCEYPFVETDCGTLVPECVAGPMIRTYDGTCFDGACVFTDEPCDPPPECFVLDGGCTAGNCTYQPRLCDTPPPDECVTGPASRQYEAVGTCDPGDICTYGFSDETCLAPANATPNCTGEGVCGYTCDLPYYSCQDDTACCEDWQPMEVSGAPTGRERHTAVWNQGTGSMIIWGGNTATEFFATGAAYSEGADSWTPLPAGNAPTPRALHTAVWTGNRMVIWGGRDATTQKGDGAVYNPAGDFWAPIDTINAPSARALHRAIWAVDVGEMVVWGGTDGIELDTGARYDPVADLWGLAPVDELDPDRPTPRSNHGAVYTGTEMIIWGGSEASVKLDDGAIYVPTEDPAGDPWLPMNGLGAPSAREGHTVVWTGTVMLIWGGGGAAGFLDDGAAYDPGLDAWTPIGAVDAPSPRWRHTAVWTGTHMIVWGGQGPTGALDTGAMYDPVGDAWTTLVTSEVASARYNHTAVWTGARMAVWGGRDAASQFLDTGALLTPP